MRTDAGQRLQSTASLAGHDLLDGPIQRQHGLRRPAIGADAVETALARLEVMGKAGQSFGNGAIVHAALLVASPAGIIHMYTSRVGSKMRNGAPGRRCCDCYKSPRRPAAFGRHE